MSDSQNDNQLLQDALTLLERADEKIKALERARCEPIAVIGMACRFPGGVKDPESFLELLRKGRDGICTVPADRWDIEAWYDPNANTLGKIHSPFGGFIAGCESFDAAFFEISPREAESLDPQQRMLLEVSWEAMERARLAPLNHFESRTGVFIGISGSDYLRFISRDDPQRINAYLGTGNAHSSASGRLSYFFGFKGPCVSLDTACSSSLVAVHAACQSLRSGESEMALAGGVNHLLMPDMSVNFSQAQMLAPDGRCKSFDARADGYVRAEGCGIVVLKRLSDALSAGDPILALIRGSAVNQDGRSSGLTVPNGPAQQMVIRDALKNAGVQPSQVSYIEAHGTGTSLGDPIEVDALGAVFGDRAWDNPLWLGSVKSNIGHLESAAGIAGLIKAILCLQNKELPRSLHFESPNPNIAWQTLPIRVTAAHMSWDAGRATRVAGISSFSFSGTNAHVLVEEFVPPAAKAQPEPVQFGPSWHGLALSARSDNALRESARQYAARLETIGDEELFDFCATAAVSRNHFECRRFFSHRTAASLKSALREFAAGADGEPARTGSSKIGFLFTGQGSQYPNMGRGLYDAEPVFRKCVQRLAGLLQAEFDIPLLKLLYPDTADGEGPASGLDNTAYTQPALFIVEYALAELWRSWGIEPDAVAGHSVGEYTAAAVAGIFSAEDGLRLIAERARLLSQLPAGGGMISVFANRRTVEYAIADYPESISIAAINGLEHVVIAGAAQALAQVVESLNGQGVRTNPLRVSHAFHSPLTEPILDAFKSTVESIAFREPNLDFVSALTGQLASSETADPAYWVRHIRQPVLFHNALNTLDELDCRLLLEIGPHPVLSGLAALNGSDPERLCLPSLRRNYDDRRQCLESLGQLYVHGAHVKWASYYGEHSGRRLDLPTYPFERKRHWFKPSSTHRAVSGVIRLSNDTGAEPFERQFRGGGFVGGHRVFGRVLLPAAAFLEMALTAAQQGAQSERVVLRDFRIHRAVRITANGVKRVQLVASANEGNGDSYQFRGREESDSADALTTYAEVRVVSDPPQDESPVEPLDVLRTRFVDELPVREFYAQCRRRGLEYDANFQLIRQLWKRDRQALARVQLSERAAAMRHERTLDTCTLDACFQVLMSLLPAAEDSSKTWLPVGLRRLSVLRTPQTALWCHAELESSASTKLCANIRLFDESGQMIAVVEGLEARLASSTELAADDFDLDEFLYRRNWERRGLVAPASSAAYLPAPAEIADALNHQLRESETLLKLDRCGAGLAELNRLSVSYITAAFRGLGCTLRKGDLFSARDIRVVIRQQPLLRRLLGILEEFGVLQRDGDGWAVIRTPDDVDPHDANRVLRERYPEIAAELVLTDRCGAALADVLSGSCEPLAELLFPRKEAITAASLFRDARGSQVFNRVMLSTLDEVCRRVPSRRGLRILEVGAGMDGAISSLVPRLDGARIEYHLADISRAMFTDIAAAATQTIRQNLAEYSFVNFLRLDIEKDAEEQGFEIAGYDIVIAPNILHATMDLRRSVKHLRRLLAPGGMLLVVEGTAAQPWVDLVYGMTAPWWTFTDTDVRPHHPLIAPERWAELLRAGGFGDVQSFVCAPAHQALILAGATSDADQSEGKVEHWLLFGEEQGVGKELSDLLTSDGTAWTLVSPGAEFSRLDERTFKINPVRSEDYLQLVKTLGTAGISHCVYLWAADESALGASGDSLPDASLRLCESSLYLTQALAGAGWVEPPRLAIVSRGAVSVSGEALPGLAAAPLWGLGKSIALEHPELRCLCIDLEAHGGPDDARAIFDELRHSTEDEVAARGNGRYVARIIRDGGDAPPGEFVCRRDASYLITGGLGDLGLHAAEWLVNHGARHLTLVSRRGAEPEARERLARLRDAEAQITIRRADVSDRKQVAELFVEFSTTLPPLRGIIHAAGTFDDGSLQELTAARFANVLAPKVAGAWLLHEQSRDVPLDFFVAYSSAASLFGSAGQANYVSANAFLDALAAARRAEQLPAVSINWGGWAEIGYAARVGAGRFLHGRGIGLLTPAQGAAALERALRCGHSQLGVVPVDWSRFFEARPSVSPVFTAFAASRVQSSGAPTDDDTSSVMDALQRQGPQEVSAWLRQHVAQQVAAVLGLESADEVSNSQTFIQMGMDSLTSIELKNRLQKGLGQTFPATIAYDYPNVSAMAKYLATRVRNRPRTDAPEEVANDDPNLNELSDQQATALLARELEAIAADSNGGESHGATARSLSPAKRALRALRASRNSVASSPGVAGLSNEPIAVIGIGCRFPGGANSPEAFWELLREGRDAITEVPPDRWDADAWYDPNPDTPGKINCRHGGFVYGCEGFDAAFFEITPREAKSLDPQHRMLLEVSWEALENSGLVPSAHVGTDTGVFIGITGNDYFSLVTGGDVERIDAYLGTGNAHSSASGRLSYFFGFKGPSISLDTACSSALVAVHAACQSIRTGECEMALAGGVNYLLRPEMSINFSKAHMLAPDGRCKAFDARADGYVRAEGCGIVVLKRLSSAVASGDPILAVIRGSAVNQDGRSGGLTVPHGPSQSSVIRRALHMTGVTPEQVSYIEAHGTGTSLGDPIEVQALHDVFGDRAGDNPLWVGTVKSNIGHLESAAGAAGLIKTILCLQGKEFVPSLHVETPNPHIDWNKLPIKVTTRRMTWNGTEKRIAGISSFSFSGTNAHVIVEEAPRPPATGLTDSPRPLAARDHYGLALSAHSETALRELAGRYSARLAGLPNERLGDICATAAIFKERFDYRLFLISDSTDDMRTALESFAAGQPCAAPCVSGRVSAGRHKGGVGFLFTGQGCQYPGMGRQLYNDEPVFRETVERLATSLDGKTKVPLLKVLFPEAGSSPAEANLLNDTAYTQPALFALEYALAELWRSWGVVPDVVAGHSVGEYVAAAVAGVFSPEDGLRLIAERGRLLSELPRDGAMFSIFAREEIVEAAIEPYRDRVSVAVVNGAGHVVISGERQAAAVIVASLQAHGVTARELNVSHAFHSPLTDPVIERFRPFAKSLSYRRPKIEFVSCVSGKVVQDEVTSPEHWVRHVRMPVRFDLALKTLRNSQARLFVEVGPQPVLSSLAETESGPGTNAVFLPSLRSKVSDQRQCLETLGRLFVHGAAVDWSAYYQGRFERQTNLPTYPFQRQRHWFSSTELCYRAVWQEKSLERPVFADATGQWLILAEQEWPELSRSLEAVGRRAIFVSPGSGFHRLSANHCSIDFDSPDGYRGLLETAGQSEGIVYLWQPTADVEAASSGINDFGLSRVVHLSRAMAALKSTPKLWLLTRGATSAGSAELNSPFATALLGLGRCLFLEHPKCKGGLIDLDRFEGEDLASRVRDELLDPKGEDCVVWRDNQRYVSRLESYRPAEAPPPRLSDDGAYLITGGLGALGLQVARFLAELGARCLVLMSRRDPSEQALDALRRLEARGCRVLVVRGDVTKEADVADLRKTVAANSFKLKGVVHAAGVNVPCSLAELRQSHLISTLAPKVSGALNLHRLTESLHLDFFICFSSISAVWGSARQAHYAAANAFLDGFVEYRRGRGLPGLAVNWGLWAGDGMSTLDGGRRVADGGLRLLRPELALSTLGQLMGSRESRVAVVDVDWTRLKNLYEVHGRQPLFDNFGGQTAQVVGADRATLVADLRATAPSERFERLARPVQSLVADVLGLDGDHVVERERGFFDMGVDSLMAVQIMDRIQRLIGRQFPPSLCFDYPTISALVEYLLLQLFPESETDESGSPTLTDVRTVPETLIGEFRIEDLPDEQIAALIDEEMKALNLE